MDEQERLLAEVNEIFTNTDEQVLLLENIETDSESSTLNSTSNTKTKKFVLTRIVRILGVFYVLCWLSLWITGVVLYSKKYDMIFMYGIIQICYYIYGSLMTIVMLYFDWNWDDILENKVLNGLTIIISILEYVIYFMSFTWFQYVTGIPFFDYELNSDTELLIGLTFVYTWYTYIFIRVHIVLFIIYGLLMCCFKK